MNKHTQTHRPGVNFTNIFWAAFLYESQTNSFYVLKYFLRHKEIGAKAGHKLMVKLTIVRSLILPCCKVQSHHKEICLNVENFTKCLCCWIFFGNKESNLKIEFLFLEKYCSGYYVYFLRVHGIVLLSWDVIDTFLPLWFKYVKDLAA